MSEAARLGERLDDVLAALARIPRRFSAIDEPADFYNSSDGEDRLDAICMVLIAVGEAFKQIDKQTDGKWLVRYSSVDWVGVKGVRDVIAHGYFDIDAEQVFAICKDDIPHLIDTVQIMRGDIDDSADVGQARTP